MSDAPTLSKEEYEQRKQILEDFKLLDKEEYEEIFRILKRHDVPFTENSNGVHFDLCLTTQTTIVQMIKFLELCKAQRFNEEARSKELESLRNQAPLDS